MIETLESRKLLSVSVVHDDNGTLRIKATGPGSDVITWTNLSSKRFRVTVNGETRTLKLAEVSLIKVNTSDGADSIDFRGIKIRLSIDAGKGSDTVYGGRRADSIFGSGGADIMYGNEDHDTLEGGLRDDTMYGGDGNDNLIPFSDPLGDDSVFGEAGVDTVDYSTETKNLDLQIKVTGNEPADVVTDDIFGDVEIIRGGSGNDNITSFLTTGISIYGGAGNDTLTGGSGADLIDGGAGTDHMFGGEGDDQFVLGALDGLADEIDGGNGADSIIDSVTDSADVITNVP